MSIASSYIPSRTGLWRLMGFWTAVALLCLLLSLASGVPVPSALVPLRAPVAGFVTIFLGIFLEALPFLVAGTMISAVLHVLVSPERLQRLSPRRALPAALVGSILGLGFPVCDCGGIPAARRLLAKGVSVQLGIAFILATPVINPVAIASTYMAFRGDPVMAASRIGLTLVTAIAVALSLGTHPRPRQLLAAGISRARLASYTPQHENQTDQRRHDPTHIQQVLQILEHTGTELVEMSRYLILGALLAAALQTLASQRLLLVLGQGRIISVLVLMALAVALSICSTVDAFVALAFVGIFTPGAILAFLILGPMIDFKTLLLLTTTFRGRVVAIMALLCFQIVFLIGILANLAWGG